MNAAHSLSAASSFQVGSVGSLRYPVERISWLAAKPAGFITLPTETDTLLRRCIGFQPISAICLIAWAANFGVVALKKMSAPEALRLMSCESTVGSAGS